MCSSPTPSRRSQVLGALAERSNARDFGVTGSVGKTSTKEALYAALDRNRPGRSIARSRATTTNRRPLSLARMPRDVDSPCSKWA